MTSFGLFLFTVDPRLAVQAAEAGVDGILVDWEHAGKEDRQRGADTQINRGTVEDLRRVRACTDRRVLCRVNAVSASTAREVQLAIEAGADELLLPMVRTVEEVAYTLDLVAGRCDLGILVETLEAVRLAPALGALPLSRVYVGLMDLQLERRSSCPFDPIADGTLESVRRCVAGPFGFGGLTLPDRGAPIPCRLLIAEMARLGCAFGILRRSFLRDIAGRDLGVEVGRIRRALADASARPPAAVAEDRAALVDAVQSWSGVAEHR